MRANWYFVVVGLLLTVSLAAAAVRYAPQTYQASAKVLLLPSSRVPSSTGLSVGNPYNVIGSSVFAAADVVRITATSPASVLGVVKKGGVPDYTLALDASSSSPIMIITARGPDQGQVVRTLPIVEALVSADLQSGQQAAGAPEATWIRASLLVADAKAKRVWKSAERYAVVAVLGGLLVSGMAIAVSETRRQRRRRRTAERQAPGYRSPASNATPSREAATHIEPRDPRDVEEASFQYADKLPSSELRTEFS
jgi:hypothetical protein